MNWSTGKSRVNGREENSIYVVFRLSVATLSKHQQTYHKLGQQLPIAQMKALY